MCTHKMAASGQIFIRRASQVLDKISTSGRLNNLVNSFVHTNSRSLSCTQQHRSLQRCPTQHQSTTGKFAAHQATLTAAHVHTSASSKGLEEFFGDEKMWHEIDIKSGRAWTVEDLRLKDNETLHKLWFVLLKERNMLLTMEMEADRQNKYMPGDDRLVKVEESMANLKKVVKERDEALNELQLGRKEKHPGRWEYTPFGFMHYVKPKEHLVPKYMNKYWSTTRRSYDPYLNKYVRLWLEKLKKQRWRRARVAYKQEQRMRKQFPDSDMWKEEDGDQR